MPWILIFQKTRQQTTIVALIAVYLSVIITGSSIIHFLERAQEWSYIDSLYFMTMTILTVGYGDLVPKTDLGKLFIIGYALIGVTLSVYILFAVGRYVVQSYTGPLRRTEHEKKD